MQILNTYFTPSAEYNLRFIHKNIRYAKYLKLYGKAFIRQYSPSKVTSEDYWVRINYAKRITKPISIEVLNEITQSKTKT